MLVRSAFQPSLRHQLSGVVALKVAANLATVSSGALSAEDGFHEISFGCIMVTESCNCQLICNLFVIICKCNIHNMPGRHSRYLHQFISRLVSGFPGLQSARLESNWSENKQGSFPNANLY